MDIFCNLVNETSAKAGSVTLSLVNNAVVEAVAKDRSAKPRTKEYPKSAVGDSPIVFMGRMVLERLANGYAVLDESDHFSTDRVNTCLTFDSNPRLELVLGQLLPRQLQPSFKDGDKVYANGMLVGREATPYGMALNIAFLQSGLTAIQATLLAVAKRCSAFDKAPEHYTANFQGDYLDLATIVKPLRQYELFGDAVLDQFQAAGVTLRSVDFRNVQSKLVGFVGI